MLVNDFKYPRLLSFFEEISKIPRPSYREEKIADYLEGFAKKKELKYYRDSLGNILIDLPATHGRENEPALLLQGHTDMVCEKNEGVEHDFLTEPLKLYVNDGWIRAEGTTLGADNGVAVAAMLAVLDGACESHGPLQCLFTVSEEVGLDGARGFDYSHIYARQMLNLDSADESLIIAGCAGGLRSSLTFPIERERAEGESLVLKIGGLAGGHSGEDINRGRANANKLMGRILYRLSAADDRFRLVSVEGGTKENAIPRECKACFVCGNTESTAELVKDIECEIRAELVAEDCAFFIRLISAKTEVQPMTAKSTEQVIFFLSTIANGVFEMNRELSGIVEYSRNLGVVKASADSFEAVVNSRSAAESRIDLSVAELDAYGKLLGGKAEHYNRYPGWGYAEHSEIRERYMKAYKELFGKEPKVEVIHAGLECGIIKEALPDMDMLSCGPVVVNLHSPDEALNIASFERFFSVILRVIK